MTDDIKFLDDSTRPEGPKFENLTIQQRAPGRHLAMIHNHFKQNMQVLRDLIDQVAAGEVTPEELKQRTEAMPMMENYRRFGALCGQHCQIIHTHHSIEDAHIFPELSAKSEAFKKVVDRLIAEHETVHALIMRLVANLNALIQNPDADNFATAKDTYETLERVLLSHFNYEEDSIGDALGVLEIAV